jgi:hypothetical protein
MMRQSTSEREHSDRGVNPGESLFNYSLGCDKVLVERWSVGLFELSARNTAHSAEAEILLSHNVRSDSVHKKLCLM